MKESFVPDFNSSHGAVPYSTSLYPSGTRQPATSQPQTGSPTPPGPAHTTASPYGGRFQVGESNGALNTSLSHERFIFRQNDVSNYRGAATPIYHRGEEYLGRPLDEAMRQAVRESDANTLQTIHQQYPAQFSIQLSKLFSVGIPGFFAVNCEQRTVLMLAAERGDLNMVDCLLTLGAQVEQREGYGRTALMIAAKKGREDVVERLLKVVGINIDKCDSKGAPALVYAAVADQTDMVVLLLRHGAGSHNSALKDRALEAAISRQNWKMASLLMDHGATFQYSKSGRNDLSFLMEAISRQFPTFVQALIERGEDLEKTDLQGQTALMHAVSARGLDTANNGSLNTEQSADPYVRARLEDEAAREEGRRVKFQEMLEMLLKAGANVYAADRQGWTPLMHAASADSDAGAERMLDRMIDGIIDRTAPPAQPEQPAGHGVIRRFAELLEDDSDYERELRVRPPAFDSYGEDEMESLDPSHERRT
ncbi:ankyrin repeat domain-containing protein [Ottowia thiooxydans]|uniref:Ankyrin repeat protein n=1 Tax=Ottowia thiooxydans TaxID=219182 RepID=A0ABV2QFV4_9BURK